MLMVPAVASAADKSVTVTWKPSADVTRTELTRSAGSGAPTTFVFSGATSTFTDAGLANGTAYDYTVKVFDDAGNSASAGTRAIPFLLAPAAAGSPQGRTGAPPLLRWHRVRGARYYNVQLFRGRKKVLSAWPARPRFQLDKTWKFHGHRYRLARGRYRWYAWPGFGPRAARRYGRLIRTGTFYFKP